MAKGTARKRADLMLVEKGLCDSREQAQRLIMAGQVFTAAGRVLKPSTALATSAALEVRERLPYVGRGGLKLAHALDSFNVSVQDMPVLDVGASTGGFTDCLLQRGARKVYAIDVGHGQLSYSLRQDPRVVAMERLNARYDFDLPEPVDLITIDVSFISLSLIIPSVVTHLNNRCNIIALVKPQFEAHKGEVGRGGVIRDPQIHARVLGRTIVWAVSQGLRVRNLCASPILGDAGNREFFLLLLKE